MINISPSSSTLASLDRHCALLPLSTKAAAGYVLAIGVIFTLGALAKFGILGHGAQHLMETHMQTGITVALSGVVGLGTFGAYLLCKHREKRERVRNDTLDWLQKTNLEEWKNMEMEDPDWLANIDPEMLEKRAIERSARRKKMVIRASLVMCSIVALTATFALLAHYGVLGQKARELLNTKVLHETTPLWVTTIALLASSALTLGAINVIVPIKKREEGKEVIVSLYEQQEN